MLISALGVARTTALALSLTALAACATSSNRIRVNDPTKIRAVLDSAVTESVESRLAAEGREEGPKVRIRTDETYVSMNRRRASFHLEEDAYVTVFNVGRDGRISVLYPSEEDHPEFLRGGHTYRVPEFFTGFFQSRSSFGFARNYGARFGRYASDLANRGGYVFIVASWIPMRLDRLEELDLWDSYSFVTTNNSVDPFRVTREYASLLVPRGKKYYTVDIDYYGDEIGRGTFSSNQCALGFAFADLGFGTDLMFSPWTRVSMYGMYGALSRGGCSSYYRNYSSFFLRSQQTGVRPQQPQQPQPPTETGGGSQPGGWKPVGTGNEGGGNNGGNEGGKAKPPRTTPEEGEAPPPKGRDRPRAGTTSTGDDVIDLGRPSNTGRERGADRDGNAWGRTRSTGTRSGTRSASGSYRPRDRSGETYSGESGRVSRPRTESYEGVRTSQPRGSEPVRSQPTRSEPTRSEPARSAPVRSEPARSSDPRPTPRTESPSPERGTSGGSGKIEPTSP
jgi:hypothetical protein